MVSLFIFWFSLLFIFYTYLGYPIALYLYTFVGKRPVHLGKTDDFPSVSVVIAARNEADVIVSRLENILVQHYPHEKIEIIVVSDGSDDKTVDNVISFRDEQKNSPSKIHLIDLSQAQGKPSALNVGVEKASGSILVFTDCRQKFAKDTIRYLVENFGDEAVGCVSGELIFMDSLESDIEAEMGVYWKYEKFIRKLESKTGSVVGVTGAVYAMRRNLHITLPSETILDDLFTPLHCYLQGKRVIFDAKAKAYDYVSLDAGKEYQRKVRTLAGNWQLFSLLGKALSPFSFSLWWKFYSHKISRLLVPFLLPFLWVTSFLLEGTIYGTVFWLQSAAYSTVFSAIVFPICRKQPLIGLCYFFTVLNSAAFVGWWKWLTGAYSKGWR